MKRWILRLRGTIVYATNDLEKALDWVGKNVDLSKKCNLVGERPAYLVGWWWMPDGDVVVLINDDLRKGYHNEKKIAELVLRDLHYR